MHVTRYLPDAVKPKVTRRVEHGIRIESVFKSSRQIIENGNLIEIVIKYSMRR